jgi:hypothetical protein
VKTNKLNQGTAKKRKAGFILTVAAISFIALSQREDNCKFPFVEEIVFKMKRPKSQ